MAAELRQFLDAAVSVARESAKIIEESLKFENVGKMKGNCTADLVTDTDIAVEKHIISYLHKSYPDHKFIAEESCSKSGCGLTDTPTWIIDPIDGTANYMHRFPYSAISIGLAINKEIVVGVVYNFFQDQMFTAVKGGGAYMNDQPIKVSNVKELRNALVITDFGYTRKEHELLPKISTVQDLACEKSHVRGIRTLGSSVCSMCMVANGFVDAYIEYGIHCWDIAAGSLIVQEAGGVALYPTGGPLDLMGRGVLVASCQQLADSIHPLVHHVDYPRDT